MASPRESLDSYHAERKAAVERLNRAELGLPRADPDAKAADLKHRLSKVSSRAFRRLKLQRTVERARRWLLVPVACILAIAVGAYLGTV